MPSIVSLPLPITLLNGTVADAGQVMTDLNAIASNVNANGAANGVNSDITALTALQTINNGVSFSQATISNSTFNQATITNSTIDANTTVPTAAVGTSNNEIASTAFVAQTAFSSALPAINAGVAHYFVTNNGSTASWGNQLYSNTIRFVDSTDQTKQLFFNLSGIPTGTTVTLSTAPGLTNLVVAPTPDVLLFTLGVC